MNARVVLGVAGASGAALALACGRHLEKLGVEIDLVISAAAERTLAEECGGAEAFDTLTAMGTLHERGNIGATIASGSAPPVAGMIVAPPLFHALTGSDCVGGAG